ncbi:S8 family serine peptidase [Nocardia uniformis]|uniref:S8 family serine peptidase n=1 Tax=Nocardia uniformis TaxID=53432 RepID=A0A849C6H4_9NOCA|nr:S8 family serine peptidase [Nocardia uniformis]NNH68571.1 S8 family serine peptidase [Nocardia uniformis]
MPTANYGAQGEPGFELEVDPDLIVVRARRGRGVPWRVGSVRTPLSGVLDDAALVEAYPEVGVEVYRLPPGSPSVEERKVRLNAAPEVRFAGRVLVDPGTEEPVLYTENIFLKFVDTATPEDCRTVLREAGLQLRQEVVYAANAYFAAAPEGTGQEVFAIANALLERDDVEYSHPELIRRRSRKTIFAEQWHLKPTVIGGVAIDAHANIEAAHLITRGAGVVVAVIDDGVDIDHPEFSGKVVAPRDATLRTDDPRPKDFFGTGPDGGDNHGTACAGVACANGILGASGVAPEARLMPIRLASGLGSQAEAHAFQWAADNGADVISCSWGPVDGDWFRPGDPVHNQVVPMPASTRLAVEYATTKGRAGKGCVILFAAGNGNESVDNDGYASSPMVVAVAACNDTGKRSVYSDFGKAVWCAFPSNDIGHPPFGHPDPRTPGIWTVDRRGADGYNPGSTDAGDLAGNFTNNFGGTSSATPGAAGIAALILSVNPDLTRQQVKDLLKASCDKIDPQGAAYGDDGHSDRYGFGRLNGLTAVRAARGARL